GCRFPGCDRPPSWCEAHHLNEWARDGGRTDVADGILLCRHHHLLIHNNAWRIKRDRANYFLIPPRERDPRQTPIPMPSKSSALADLQRRRRAG
ncbi:HNH endonuclease signature motif containing protein, partial [Lysobacter korlensis]